MILNLMWGKCLKKKKFMNMYEWKNKFFGVYIFCMFKLVRLELVCVFLFGKWFINMV